MRDPQVGQEGMGQVRDSASEPEKAEQLLERRRRALQPRGLALQIHEVTEERPEYEDYVTPRVKIKKWGWEGD